MAAGKFTDTFAVLRRLNVLIRHEMIQHERDLVLVKNAVHLHLIHLVNRHRRCDIISENQIQICLNELPCTDRRKSGMRRKNLLCHCHTHILSPPTIKLYFRVCVIFI